MIYENQPLDLRIKAQKVVLSDYKTLKVKYRDPSGDEDIWNAEIYPADNRYIFYNIPINILSHGDWTVWSYITFNNDKPYAGKAVTFNVREEGT